MRQGEAGVSGSLFDLPAGAVQLAAGVSYRKEYLNQSVDSGVETNLIKNGSDFTLVCSGPGSICSSAAQGGFSVKEAYAELLVPILKDLPFVHSLNLDVGTRYSKYSNFGSTNNWKVALEFKPVEDLLLRGTVSKVFRAPSVSDLFGGPAGDSPTATDPCVLPVNAANKACPGLVPNTGTSQVNAHRRRFAVFERQPRHERQPAAGTGQVVRLRLRLRSELGQRPVAQRRLLPHRAQQPDRLGCGHRAADPQWLRQLRRRVLAVLAGQAPDLGFGYRPDQVRVRDPVQLG